MAKLATATGHAMRMFINLHYLNHLVMHCIFKKQVYQYQMTSFAAKASYLVTVTHVLESSCSGLAENGSIRGYMCRPVFTS